MLNASRVRDQAPRCGQVLGIGAAKRLALKHLAGGKALAHDQTPSLSTRVSEVVHCVLWCAQSKVNSRNEPARPVLGTIFLVDRVLKHSYN